MSDEVTETPAKKGGNGTLYLAVALVLAGTALSYYFMQKWKCPCSQHTTGDEPIIKVAKASAEMAPQGPSPSVEDPPAGPRDTAPGGNTLPPLSNGNGFAPREVELPKLTDETKPRRRTTK